MVLLTITYAIALSAAAGVLAPVRAWVHSARGIDSVRAWPAPLVIPLQTAIALIWLQALFAFPWMVWNLHQMVGDPWWSMFRALHVVFLMLVVPVTIALVDNLWLRLHPLPDRWNPSRILLGGVAAIAISTSLEALPVDGARDAAAMVFAFAILTTMFLTRWWLINHPVRRG